MKPVTSPLLGDATEEIAALIGTLHDTQQRLEVLTEGEVDSVADRDGRSFLLRRAQEQQRHSEAAKQAAILNALPAHIALLDSQGVVISVNEAWRQFAPIDAMQGPGHAIGLNYAEICDSAWGMGSAEAHQVAAGIRSVLSGAAKSFSSEYPCSSPLPRWFLMTVTPLTDDRPNGAVVMHLDITERKRDEASLLQFRSGMDATTDAIMMVNRTTLRFVEVNATACAMLGYTREELFRLGPAELGAATPAQLASAYDAIIAGKGAGELKEVGMRRKDGSLLQVEVSRHAIRTGVDWVLVGVLHDITERKRAEQELRDSEQRFRSLTVLSSDWFWEQDTEHRFVGFSGGEGVEGWGPDQAKAVGQRRWELPSIVPLDGDWTEHKALLDAHKPFKNFEYRRYLGDGSLQYVAASGEPVFDAGGGFAGYRGVATDITARKQAENRIRRLNRVYAMLSGINGAIVHMRDRKQLFQEVCRIAVDTGGLPFCWLCMVDGTGKQLEPVGYAGPDDGFLDLTIDRLSLQDDAPDGYGISALSVREKRAIRVSDVATSALIKHKKPFADRGIRSSAAFPLLIAGRAIGSFALNAAEVDFFDDEEMKLLKEVADNIAFALEHIEKEEKVRRLTRVYAVSSGITSLIVHVDDRQQLFREACRIAVEDGKFAMAWIGAFDPATQDVTPVAWAGEAAEELSRAKSSARDDTPRGVGAVGMAIRARSPILNNNILAHSFGGPRLKEIIRLGFQSQITLPLYENQAIVATLTLYTKERGYFDEDEVRLLTELAADISFALENISRQHKLDYLAYYDELTGLANRRLFLERLAQHMRSAVSSGHKLALFFLDLERFRNINESLGRPAGDALLKQVAEWLLHNVGDPNLIARVGADHFAIVLPEIKQEGDVPRLLDKRIREFVEHPFRLNDTEIRIATKVGVALFPNDGTDADTLLRNAEAALKQAKERGDRVLFYTQTMNEAVAGNLTLENQLRQALENEEFVLHFQPKVNLNSGKLASAEALIRWNDPRTGLVPPGRFIPILEETGLIHEVGRWALRTAIAQYLRWRAAGLPAVRIAVNVSPLQLRSPGFIAELRQAIGIDAHAAEGLELEITESVIMEDVKHCIGSLQAIREMGVTIAIDDFGTGFSSLSYLSKLPVDTLKIDRAFVIEMTNGPDGMGLVATIINLAHSFKLKVVAEGVETEEQSRLLRLLNCDEMQGYLFSKPVPAGDFEARFLAASALAA